MFNVHEKINFSKKQLTKIKELTPYLTLPQLADYFEIDQRTFHKIIERDDKARALYKSAKAKKIVMVASKLLDNIAQGDKASIFFYLKTQAGWRERNYTFDEDFQKEFNGLQIDDIKARQGCLFKYYLEGKINEYQFELLSNQLKGFADNVLYHELQETVNQLKEAHK